MDFWTNPTNISVIFSLALIGWLVVSRTKRSSTRRVEIAVAEENARLEFDSLPKCVCGEVARYPAPVLKRDRGAWDWLRNYFAAPPRYKRAVDMMLAPVFCESHVHVADAMMDQFIFRVRSEYSALNGKIAADAAGFEQEALLKCVSESLTENQKRAVRKAPTQLRVLPMKTGTDDVPSDGG
jgi:hypothetical protein